MTTTAEEVPLVTDLDGTLVHADTGIEALKQLIRRRPVALIAALTVLPVMGLSAFKRQVAAYANLDATCLPYNVEFIDFLQAKRAAGRTIHLATATDAKHAHAVAQHLGGLFTEVHASDGRVNLKGASKASLLLARFGERGFDYAGDSRADLAVWPHARRAILVNVTPAVEQRLRTLATDVEVFSRR